LDEPLIRSDSCRTLANARVVWADYDLIKRDFANVDFAASLPRDVNPPHGANAPPVSDRPDIDAWLLRYAAVMSETQLRYTNTSEEIPVFGPARTAYRPPRYGRALVVQLTDTWPDRAYSDPDRRPRGLLDVKGCGVAPGRVPLPQLHRSGLLGLPTALCELVSQLIMEKVFEYLEVDVRGVGLYAILDLGFRMKREGGTSVPAGALVRRAHQRPVGNIERPGYDTEPHRIKLAIEFMLRRLGVTSCAPVVRLRIWREGEDLRSSFLGVLDKIPSAGLERFLRAMSLQAPVEFDLINVQLVRGATLAPLSAVLVDFGQYELSVEQFVVPLASLVEKRPLTWGGFIDSNSPYWIQPNPQISLDENLVGATPTPSWIFEWAGMGSPAETSGLFVFAAELARDVTRAGLTRSALEKRISTFVASATRKLDHRAEGNDRDWRTALPNPETVGTATPAGLLDALAHVEGYLAQNKLRWQHRSKASAR
jgi:hypothetical protein